MGAKAEAGAVVQGQGTKVEGPQVLKARLQGEGYEPVSDTHGRGESL